MEPGKTMEIQSPRGTHDIVPQESSQWQYLEASCRAVIQAAGYREIRTPVFEHTELFKRGVGETTDIVGKEMYTFSDKSDRSLTLRPEGTAGVVRAYLDHGMHRQPAPVKLWYVGPMFRYERAQTGRQRQFHQVGIEVFGSAGPAVDAEVIVLAADCMARLGVESFTVHINSIGCKTCRPAYREALKDAIRPHLSKLCEDCTERFERNPLRMLDCKHKECQSFYKDAPKALDHLCQDCKEHFDGLRQLLEVLGVRYLVNERLVRGLDYYSRTVFELITDDPRLGAQSTILAGGRYDYLVETLGGPSTPAVGWAMGMERVLMMMDKGSSLSPLAFIVAEKTEVALKMAFELRRQGIACELDFPPLGSAARKFQKQLERAAKSEAAWTLIAGERELESNTITVKNMSDSSQQTLPVEKIVTFLQEHA
jgi:histidyl-tRNA synthetase